MIYPMLSPLIFPMFGSMLPTALSGWTLDDLTLPLIIHFDVSDLSTVWQDDLRTIPAAVGQPVGALEDLSGNGRHAIQTTASKRPMLRKLEGPEYYLEFDGTDDYLETATFTEELQPMTYVLAGAVDETVAAQRPHFFNSPSSHHLGIDSSGTMSAWAGMAGLQTDVFTLPIPTDVWLAVMNGVPSVLRKDGLQLVTGNPGTQGISGITLGANSGGTIRLLEGTLFGFILIDGDASTDMHNLEVYMAAKADRTLWTPADLFKSGEKGMFYDPSNLGSLYQTSDLAPPVTADGQPVGRMEDLSGNGNHGLQVTASKRPLYETDNILSWLQGDNADDVLDLGLPGVTGNTDRTMIFAGSIPTDGDVLFTMGTTASGQLWAISNSGGGLKLGVFGGSFVFAGSVTTKNVFTLSFSGTTLADSTLTIGDGTPENATGTKVINTTDADTALLANSSGTNPMQDPLYGFLLIDRLLTADETIKAKRYFATKSGVTL